MADSGKDGHSIFAYYFLKTLAENSHPFISAKLLGAEVEKLVARNSDQTPVSKFIHGVGDEDGQFFFINKHSRKIPAPPAVKASFDDIIQDGERRKSWGAWQVERETEYRKAREIDDDEYIDTKRKSEAWTRFLKAVASDNPYSDVDETMRYYAEARILHWNSEKSKINRAPKASVIPSEAESSMEKVREIGRDGSFIAYDNGIVKDTNTGLMWAAKDNGENINWEDAKKYCDNYRGGGHTDWRLPTLDELKTIYDSQNGYTPDCSEILEVYICKLIKISCFWIWSSEIRGSEAGVFDFDFRYGSRYWHRQSNSDGSRVLPVRGGK